MDPILDPWIKVGGDMDQGWVPNLDPWIKDVPPTLIHGSRLGPPTLIHGSRLVGLLPGRPITYFYCLLPIAYCPHIAIAFRPSLPEIKVRNLNSPIHQIRAALMYL